MTRLIVASYNLHALAVKRQPKAVRKDIDFIMSVAHVAGLQEAGEGDAMMTAVARSYGVWNGPNEASESTPVLWQPGIITPRRKRSVHLTAPTQTHEPEAAGGPRAKEKWLNSITFRFGGRWFTFGGLHTTPSIWAPNHDTLNETQVRTTAEWMGARKTLPIVVGDWNQPYNASNMNPMRRNGLKSMQQKYGPVDTLGNRPIDDVWYRPDTEKIRPVRLWKRNGVSDHHILFAEFEVKAK